MYIQFDGEKLEEKGTMTSICCLPISHYHTPSVRVRLQSQLNELQLKSKGRKAESGF